MLLLAELIYQRLQKLSGEQGSNGTVWQIPWPLNKTLPPAATVLCSQITSIGQK